MVQLVQHHQRLFGETAAAHHFRSGADVLIGHRRAVIVRSLQRPFVRQGRIKLQPDGSRGIRPLPAQVAGRTDHQKPLRTAGFQKLVGRPQCEPRFPRGRRRHGQKVRRVMGTDGLKRAALPIAKRRSPSRRDLHSRWGTSRLRKRRANQANPAPAIFEGDTVWSGTGSPCSPRRRVRTLIRSPTSV